MFILDKKVNQNFDWNCLPLTFYATPTTLAIDSIAE